MIRFKKDVNVLAMLKDKGFSSYEIQRKKLINQAAVQKLREGKLIAWEQLGRVCDALGCQPGDLLENVPDPAGSDAVEEE